MGQWLRPRTNIIKGNLESQDVWSENDIRKLVCLYKRNPCLWKRDDPFYLVAERKRRAYERIHRDMRTCSNRETNKALTFVEIMMKLREVRKFYVTELKKVLLSKSNCCRYVPTTKWFYELHDFLYPYLDYDETSELQSIADRWIAKCNSENRPKEIENCCKSGKHVSRQIMPKFPEQFKGKSVEHTVPCSCRRKAIRSMREPRKHWQTPYATSVIHRKSSDRFVSCSSSDSTTNYASSCSDVSTETTTSSTIICENKLARERERTSESWESGSTNDPSNVAICGTKRSLENPKRRRSTRNERNEIFTKRESCQSRRIKACSAFRPRTEIRTIRYGRTFRPNFNSRCDS